MVAVNHCHPLVVGSKDKVGDNRLRLIKKQLECRYRI